MSATSAPSIHSVQGDIALLTYMCAGAPGKILLMGGRRLTVGGLDGGWMLASGMGFMLEE